MTPRLIGLIGFESLPGLMSIITSGPISGSGITAIQPSDSPLGLVPPPTMVWPSAEIPPQSRESTP